MALLFATMILMVLNLDSFNIPKNVSLTKEEQSTDQAQWQALRGPLRPIEDIDTRFSEAQLYFDFQGSETLRQPFVAEEDMIRRARLFFLNPDGTECRGSVRVSVEDAAGSEICATEIDSSIIRSEDETAFDFIMGNEDLNANNVTTMQYTMEENSGIELTRGELYYLVVEGRDIESQRGFAIRAEQGADGYHLMAGAKLIRKGTKLFAILLGFLLLCLCLILLPLDWLRQRLERKWGRCPDLNVLFSRILFLLAPLVSLFCIYKIMGRRVGEMLQGWGTGWPLLNLFVIGVVWLLAYILINRTRVATMVTVFVWAFFGFANYLLLLFRNSPLTASDFLSMGTAMGVASTYEPYLNRFALFSLIVAIGYLALALSLKGYRGLERKKRLALALAVCVYLGGFYELFLGSTYLEDHKIRVGGFRPRIAYAKYGYPLAFMITVANAKVKEPENYSLERVEEIAARYSSDPAGGTAEVSEERPNIIVVMNESLADVSVFGTLTTTPDYMPFIRNLKEDTVRGTLHVSVFGGSTANSEYEFLTGNSMSLYPVYSAPYNTLSKGTMPSIARKLEQLGYGGLIAFHPGMTGSYNRNNVYPVMGFKKHIALEDLQDPELVRTFVSDAYNYQIVEEEYEKFRKENGKQPFFLFNVTIQNHGGFLFKTGMVEQQVAVDDPALSFQTVEQYVNLIKLTDQATEDLIDYFKQVEEPTVILLYGDHEPNLGDSFMDKIGEQQENQSMDANTRYERQYQTPFFIWANYDIEEEEGVEISANYLASYLMETLNLPLSGYDKFLLEMRETLPFFSAIGYRDQAGQLYVTNKDTAYQDLIEEYTILQYNNAVDRKHRREDFFRLKE